MMHCFRWDAQMHRTDEMMQQPGKDIVSLVFVMGRRNEVVVVQFISTSTLE